MSPALGGESPTTLTPTSTSTDLTAPATSAEAVTLAPWPPLMGIDLPVLPIDRRPQIGLIVVGSHATLPR